MAMKWWCCLPHLHKMLFCRITRIMYRGHRGISLSLLEPTSVPMTLNQLSGLAHWDDISLPRTTNRPASWLTVKSGLWKEGHKIASPHCYTRYTVRHFSFTLFAENFFPATAAQQRAAHPTSVFLIRTYEFTAVNFMLFIITINSY